MNIYNFQKIIHFLWMNLWIMCKTHEIQMGLSVEGVYNVVDNVHNMLMKIGKKHLTDTSTFVSLMNTQFW